MSDDGGGLAGELTSRQTAAERELDEIALLMRQARTEADRHAARRDAAAERLTVLMDQHAVPAEVREAHEQLMLQYQRSALMTAQMEVLEGKQKVLLRLQSSLGEVVSALESAGFGGIAGGPGAELPAAAATNDARPRAAGAHVSAVLSAQEEMRRAIARQMHDGPAQSIANIALQAEIVQRLLGRDMDAAQRELEDLRGMVQHALDATKSFIFEVRPMVLDDLGLVPTLRRATGEHQRRSGLPVRFESVGPDRRLEPQMETQLFRIIDDALAEFAARGPTEIGLRLNWTESALTVVVRSRPPASTEEPITSAPRSGGEMPTALAEMIRDQDADVTAREESRRQGFALPPEVLRDLADRASMVGLELVDAEGGLRIQLIIGLAEGTKA